MQLILEIASWERDRDNSGNSTEREKHEKFNYKKEINHKQRRNLYSFGLV